MAERGYYKGSGDGKQRFVIADGPRTGVPILRQLNGSIASDTIRANGEETEGQSSPEAPRPLVGDYLAKAKWPSTLVECSLPLRAGGGKSQQPGIDLDRGSSLDHRYRTLRGRSVVDFSSMVVEILHNR